VFILPAVFYNALHKTFLNRQQLNSGIIL